MRAVGLALSSRFDLAYNAAHSFSLAALRWHGFRSESRYLVFQAIPHTLGLPATTWRVLAKAHEAEGLPLVGRSSITKGKPNARPRESKPYEGGV